MESAPGEDVPELEGSALESLVAIAVLPARSPTEWADVSATLDVRALGTSLDELAADTSEPALPPVVSSTDTAIADDPSRETARIDRSLVPSSARRRAVVPFAVAAVVGGLVLAFVLFGGPRAFEGASGARKAPPRASVRSTAPAKPDEPPSERAVAVDPEVPSAVPKAPGAASGRTASGGAASGRVVPGGGSTPGTATAVAAVPRAAQSGREEPRSAVASIDAGTGVVGVVAAAAPAPGVGTPAAPAERDLDTLLDRVAGPAPKPVPSAPAPEAPVDPNLPPTPSQTAVARALAGAMPSLRQCAGGKTGLATASLMLKGDGSVASVVVGGSPFGGADEGRCMERVLTRLTFPPFRQSSYRVTYPFSIRSE